MEMNAAKSSEPKTLSEDVQQYLTFTLDQEEYGVDIMMVREVKGWTETTRLPNMPEYLRGVLNLRGLIIPIFDLRARFIGSPTEAQSKHVIIVLAVGARNIGILVDAVSDILNVRPEEIKPAPTTHTQVESTYINGLISLGDRMVVLLNVDLLFNPSDIEAISGAA